MNTQSDFSRVLEKITEIVEKSADGDYIYRGEQECYDKVSSNLYREAPHTDRIPFDIGSAQQAILEEARGYVGKTADIDETYDIEILTELQHFGGNTNLIDFTEDYLIALFFACDGSDEEEGRVILLKNDPGDDRIKKPRRTTRRVESQKSIFVESPEGFIEPNAVVTIPVDMKPPMLDYLRKHHRISIETIYNDLHGFIRRSASGEFLKGLTRHSKAIEAETPEKKHEHYENAVRHYTETLKLKPDFADAYNNRGAAYHEIDKFDKAIQDYSMAINLNPVYADVYYNRGKAYQKKGEFDLAIQDYSKVIDLNPDFADAYHDRGVVYNDKGEFDKAIHDFNKAIDLNPEDAMAYNNRGNAYFHKREFDLAIQDYSKAIDLNPKYADAYSNRGVAYNGRGDSDKAIQDLSNAIDLNPNFAIAYNNRGTVYARKGEFDKAIQDCSTAIALNPDAIAYYNRGEAWLHLREWEKAKADLMIAKHIGVDIVDAFHNVYESVEAFEAEQDVKVPADIAALLSS